MNEFLTAVQHVAKRETRQMFARPLYLISTVLVMAFMCEFYITLMHRGTPDNMPIAIIDKDGSSISRRLVHELQATEGVSAQYTCANFTEARKLMQEGKIYGILEIPNRFYADLASQMQPKINFYVTYAYTVGGTSAYKQLLTLTNLINGAFLQQILKLKGMAEYELMNIVQPVRIDGHMLFNPWGNYAIYLLTTILPGTLGIIVLMLTIFSVGIELKDSTSHDWLRAAGKDYYAAMVGKLLPYTILFFVLAMSFLTIMYTALHFPMNGRAWMLILNVLGLIISMQCFGVILIGLLPVLRDALSAGALLGMMNFTMSGFTFPNIGMLPCIRSVAYLFPLRHHYLAYVNEALLQAPLSDTLPTLLAYVGYMIAAWLVGKRLCNAMVYLRYPKK